jgi:23S rRNA (cytosine1962-C5)-methyltransferase
MNSLPRLRLKRHEDRRLRRGHHWVYSNEVDNGATPLKGFAAGDMALLEDARGAVLGVVDVEPQQLLCARLLDRHADARCDADWLLGRLRRALALRQRLYVEPYYRLVYGDSDGLSGLVVDRFGDHFVAQLNSAGMQRRVAPLREALEALLPVRSLRLRGDDGTADPDAPGELEVVEEGVRFAFDAAAGQKTGWFYDHRENRTRAAALAPGLRVLDVFSYVGAWGLRAAAGGARGVTCIDSSAPALERAARNAGLNDLDGRLSTRCGDAGALLRAAHEAGERYDMVILDPPALIKRRRDQKSGEAAYRRLNQLAMRLLADDGILVSASCSMHLDESALIGIVRDAAQRSQRLLQVFALGGQGADHPLHPAIAETRYLKALFCRVLS